MSESEDGEDGEISYGSTDPEWGDDEPLQRTKPSEGDEDEQAPDADESSTQQTESDNSDREAEPEPETNSEPAPESETSTNSDTEASNDEEDSDAEEVVLESRLQSQWDWDSMVPHPAYAKHASDVSLDVEQPEFDLIPVSEDQLQPFKDAKESVHEETDQVNVRARQEVQDALKQAERMAEDQFESDNVPKTYVYEALLIAGSYNLDLAMGILGTYGYGLRDRE